MRLVILDGGERCNDLICALGMFTIFPAFRYRTKTSFSNSTNYGQLIFLAALNTCLTHLLPTSRERPLACHSHLPLRRPSAKQNGIHVFLTRRDIFESRLGPTDDRKG